MIGAGTSGGPPPLAASPGDPPEVAAAPASPDDPRDDVACATGDSARRRRRRAWPARPAAPSALPGVRRVRVPQLLGRRGPLLRGRDRGEQRARDRQRRDQPAAGHALSSPSSAARVVPARVAASPSASVVRACQPSSSAASPGARQERRTSPGRARAPTRSQPERAARGRARRLAARRDVAEAGARGSRPRRRTRRRRRRRRRSRASGRRRRTRSRTPPVDGRGAEHRDHARLAARVLARAVDVGQPQDEAPTARAAGVVLDVALGGRLGHGVRRSGLRRRGLGRRDHVRVAVDRAAGRGQHEARGAASAALLEHGRGADDVERASCAGSATARRTSICAARW